LKGAVGVAKLENWMPASGPTTHCHTSSSFGSLPHIHENWFAIFKLNVVFMNAFSETEVIVTKCPDTPIIG
jgi:hypothetical protein